MNRTPTCAASAVSALILVSACGNAATTRTTGPASTSGSTSASMLDLPGETYRIPAGRYVTHDFEPHMVMTLPDKVWGNDEDLPQFLVLYTQGNDADKDNRCTLLFLSPTQVLDPNEFGKVDPLPVNVVAWLQSHPYLTTLSQTNTTVGGLPAVQLEFVVKTGLPFSDAAFGHHVKFLFPPGRGGDRVPAFGVGSGDTGSIIVVQVGAQPVVVIPDKAHPGCDFSTFGPQQQALLTTLRFAR